MESLAQSAGYDIVQDGERVLFFDRGGRPLGWVAYVLGLIALITTANGIIQLVLVVTDRAKGHLLAGGILLAVGTVFITATTLTIRSWRRGRQVRYEELVPLLIADRHSGMLTDSSGRPLARLMDVRIMRRLKMSSSSPTIDIQWPGGQCEIFRFSPVGAAVGQVITMLRQHGIGPP